MWARRTVDQGKTMPILSLETGSLSSYRAGLERLQEKWRLLFRFESTINKDWKRSF
jgi:hypothetical protein